MESQRRILRFLFAIIGGVTFILLLTYQPTKSTHRHTIKVDSSHYYKTELKKLKKELARQKKLLKKKTKVE
ncbi:hypothetical protein BKI52_28595 [marine bacterium AO1-C]|nr:hypothetical protein BKI52_28595 [marine bacterium AO1-C]